MKHLIPCLFLILLFYSCKSNNYITYHRYINEAEYSFYNEDYKKASDLYGKAFKKVKIPFEDDMYFYSASLWEVGEYDKSISLLDTLYITEWALNKSGRFQGIDSTMKNDILVRNKASISVIHEKRDNHPILAILDSIRIVDQEKRIEIKDYEFEHPYDTLRINQMWMEVKHVDSLNMVFIDSLNNVHGFIGGVYFPSNPRYVGFLLIHQMDWVYIHKKELIRAIKQGRLLPVDFAKAYDKALFSYGDTVVYYGQFTSMLEGIEPEEVFKRCRKIGLSPYYIKWVNPPKKKGLQPEKHLYYDYYEARKNRFSCY